MYPILFQWNTWIIPTWHILFLLAVFCGYRYMQRLRSQIAPGIPIRYLDTLFALVYIAGFLGARLFSFFTDESLYDPLVQIPLWHIFVPGPMTFYGGALAGFGMGLGFCLWKKMPLGALLDCLIPAVLLGLCIGRIGCFLNGDDFGLPAQISPNMPTPWWVVTFPNHPVPVPRYPVQLMESGASFLLLLCCAFLRKRSLRVGQVGLLGIIGYGLVRFFLEYLRGDVRGWVVEAFLSPAQLVSLLLVAAGVVTLYGQKLGLFGSSD